MTCHFLNPNFSLIVNKYCILIALCLEFCTFHTIIRDSIHTQLNVKNVILCDASFGDKSLCKVTETQTILSSFKHNKQQMNIITKVNNQNYLNTLLFQIRQICNQLMNVPIDMSKWVNRITTNSFFHHYASYCK